MTGPPAMPFPWFEEDENLYLLQRFCGLCAEEGVFFHPHHNWFLCASHGEAEIDEELGLFVRIAQRCHVRFDGCRNHHRGRALCLGPSTGRAGRIVSRGRRRLFDVAYIKNRLSG